MVRCNECGSETVVKAGYRRKVVSKSPPVRIMRQQYLCKNCLKIFVVNDDSKEEKKKSNQG
jgi:transposase-like protein